MNVKKRIASYAVAATLGVLISINPYWAHGAHANPEIFPPSSTSAVATSTLQFLTAGSTVFNQQYDAYTYYFASSTSQGQQYALENAVVMVADTASSSSSVLNVSIQYSQNGIDWYADDVNGPQSTTTPQNLNNINVYKYASTVTTTTYFAFPIKTPTRFVRAVFTATGANLGLYAQITPQRQVTSQ